MANFTKLRKWLVKVLKIDELPTTYSISREYTFQTNAAKNQLWYNGSAYELEQFYTQNDNNQQCFWGSRETRGQEIRRIHTGLPALIVDILTNVTAKDLNDISFDDESMSEIWEAISKENNFDGKLSELVRTALVSGDGAVKFGFNLDVSASPTFEVVSGERVDFITRSGRLHEVVFYTHYNVKDKDYTLEERYGYGYIHYQLYKDGDEVDINAIPQTAGLEDVEFDSKVILAVPFKFFESTKWQGRGRSIYDNKIDSFDALDETASQWIDALRRGRTKTYIPECLIPRDNMSGALLKPNAFDNQFIKIGDDLSEGSKNQITTVQPEIKTDAYLQTYITLLDIALQGLVSPSSLGIDVKKLDNAESQREKEKVTLYTRSAIISSLQYIIKDIVNVAFETLAIMNGTSKFNVDCEVTFGEYANPSFEAVLEAMSNPNTPMSIEARVDEIWGNTKSDEWKAEEVARIKAERGIVELDEPALNIEL
jgi:hypothetical protein